MLDCVAWWTLKGTAIVLWNSVIVESLPRLWGNTKPNCRSQWNLRVRYTSMAATAPHVCYLLLNTPTTRIHRIHWIHPIQAQSTIQWLCHCRRLRQIPSISLNHLFYKEAGAVQFHIYSITGSHPPHRWKNTQEILNSRWRIITQQLSLTKKDLDVLQIHNVRYNM